LGAPTPTVIGSTGCLGRVAEWQTRWLQVPVSFGTWGFKSPFAHIDVVLLTQRHEVTNSEESVTLLFLGDLEPPWRTRYRRLEHA
jgi:hypothetical protein